MRSPGCVQNNAWRLSQKKSLVFCPMPWSDLPEIFTGSLFLHAFAEKFSPNTSNFRKYIRENIFQQHWFGPCQSLRTRCEAMVERRNGPSVLHEDATTTIWNLVIVIVFDILADNKNVLNMYCQKLESLAYISAADSMGLSSFKISNFCGGLRKTSFLQQSAYRPFKVIQGR